MVGRLARPRLEELDRCPVEHLGVGERRIGEARDVGAARADIDQPAIGHAHEAAAAIPSTRTSSELTYVSWPPTRAYFTVGRPLRITPMLVLVPPTSK